MLPPQNNAQPMAQPSGPVIPGGSPWNLQNPAVFGYRFPVNSPSFVNGLAGIASPSSQTQSPALTTPEQMVVKAGDVFQIQVGAAGPVNSAISNDGLVQYLQTTGIASDVAVMYSPGPWERGFGAPGTLTITGRVNDAWPNAQSLCAEVLKLTVAAGQPLDLNTLSCVITPTAPATPKAAFEVPGWLILLLLSGALWFLWKSSK